MEKYDAGIYDDYMYYLKVLRKDISREFNVDYNSVTFKEQHLTKKDCILHFLSYQYDLLVNNKYICSVPRMSNRCYFIIDGQERVIPSREKKRVSTPTFAKDVTYNSVAYSSSCKVRFYGCMRTCNIGVISRVAYVIINKKDREEYNPKFDLGYPLGIILSSMSINVRDVLSYCRYPAEVLLLLDVCKDYNADDIDDVVIKHVINLRFQTKDVMQIIQLSYILDSLVDLHYRRIQETNLDNYSNKEVLTPGYLYKRQIARSIRTGKYDRACMDIYRFILTGSALTSGKTLKGFSAEYGRRSFIDGISSIRKVVLQCDINSTDETVRSINLSQHMFICPSDTPESKEIGIVKSYALSVTISKCVSISKIMRLLSGSYTGDIPVVVNHLLSFFLQKYDNRLFKKLLLRYIKRQKYVTGFFDNKYNILYIRCDSGRLVRPVTNNRYTIYIDCDDKQYKDRGLHNIDDSYMLGYVASHIPFIQHNPGSRSVFGCSIIKQGLSQAITNTLYSNKFLIYGQRSICYTKSTLLMEREESICNTTNAVVAISTFGGFNQEDSIVVNKASIERGLFSMQIRITSKILVSNNNDILYMVKLRDKVKQGDTLCVYISEEYGTVTNAIIMFNPKNRRIFTVTDITKSVVSDTISYLIGCTTIKTPNVGDKLSSKHGQKGVISMICKDIDMPFTINQGIIPDIIINPHAIPSRMTVGHILEMCIGKTTSYYDATGFKQVNIKDIQDNLINIGMDSSGKEYMASGLTGELFDEPVLIGLCSYLTMKQISEDKIRSRNVGIRSQYSYQPQSGSKGEGLRIGEMENDCLISHNCLQALHDFTSNSDMIESYICRSCKLMIDNKKCNICDNSDNVIVVNIPYSLRMFKFTLEAMGVTMFFDCVF